MGLQTHLFVNKMLGCLHLEGFCFFFLIVKEERGGRHGEMLERNRLADYAFIPEDMLMILTCNISS
jgi:hypothetical protein